MILVTCANEGYLGWEISHRQIDELVETVYRAWEAGQPTVSVPARVQELPRDYPPLELFTRAFDLIGQQPHAGWFVLLDEELDAPREATVRVDTGSRPGAFILEGATAELPLSEVVWRLHFGEVL